MTVFFDLDGTLLDGYEAVRLAVSEVCPDLLCELSPKVLGDGFRYWADARTGRGEETCAAIFARAERHERMHARAYGALREALASLDGVDLGVISARPQRSLEGVLRIVYPAERWRIVLGGRRRKSDREVYREALSLVGNPGVAAMVSDSVWDLRGARAAGLVSVGAAWGYGAADDLRGETPIVLDRPEQIVDLARALEAQSPPQKVR